MSKQFGMQTGAAARSSGINVYTGLLVVACLALGLGCAWMYGAASAVSPDGNPFTLQDANKIVLQTK